LREADRCCGSAGIYNLVHPELSAKILEEKIANIARTGAQIVATGNPGCLMQINQALRARKLSVRAVHPIELLDQAYADRPSATIPAPRSST
jgi:glycolate dehydrogenase iron-sulfur subunit